MVRLYCLILITGLWFPASFAHSDVNTVPEQYNGTQTLYAKASVERLYREKQGALQWTDKSIQALIGAIETSSGHGLNPEDYHLNALQTPSSDKIEQDILATDAYLTLAGHLLGGKLNPVSLEPTWTAQGREKDLVSYLAENLTQENIAQSLETLAPQQPRYHIMQKALQKYLAISALGGWPTVPEGPILKPGMESSRIPALRYRLALTEDVKADDNSSAIYDESLAEAVKKFQQRANLEPDGIIGPATLREINRTPQDRINQIRVNLERWRWLPEDLGEKHIRVNIADYRLEAHEGNEISEVFDVVVGKTYRKTPVFSASMTYLVFNPWWDTPLKIARQDLLPKFQKNPALVQELGYQVLNKDRKVIDSSTINWNQYSASNFPFYIRQKPGDKNALGHVKFIFPNEHNVYLHDTSSRELFSKTRRDFSSGCIRVKNPMELAEWVLKTNQDWPRSKIDEELATGKEKRVTLKKPVMVHLLYWTVVVNDVTKDIRFIEDIYDRDSNVLAKLDQRPS